MIAAQGIHLHVERASPPAEREAVSREVLSVDDASLRERFIEGLEEPAVLECLRGLGRYLQGEISPAAFAELTAQATCLANQHQGSKSIDGCGHAAVSATYSVANALAGKARQAAEYAAYAMVYGQGGYAAVAERESFQPEFDWQAACLASLAAQHPAAHTFA